QVAVFGGSQVSVPSTVPSPHCWLQSAGQVGESAVSQVSPAAVSTTPLPQSALTHETFVLMLFWHSPFFAVTVTNTPVPPAAQVSVASLAVGGAMVPVAGVASAHS